MSGIFTKYFCACLSIPPHDAVCWLCLVLWLLVLFGPMCLCTWPIELPCWLRALLGPKYLFTRSIHAACWFLLATLVVRVVGPSVSDCCHLDMGARGTLIWGPMLPLALERCSLCAWHMVFAWGWRVPSVLGAVLLRHWPRKMAYIVCPI